MNGHSNYLLKSLLLAAAYVAAGELSQLLAIPPGFASPIWPPAGIALAAILIMGFSYLPAVFLGSYTTNMLIALHSGADISSSSANAIAFGIASGAVLQAAISAYLVKGVVSLPSTFSDFKDIVKLILRGGVIGSLVNALIGPLILLTNGIITTKAFVNSVFIWWVGDLIGVVLFTPMLILLANRSVTKLRKFVVSLPTFILTALIISAFLYAKEEVSEKLQNEIDSDASAITIEFKNDIRHYSNILQSIEQLFNASGQISSSEFTIFTQKYIEQHPGLLTLSFNPKVSHAERDAFEEHIRQQGFTDFRIKDRIGSIDQASSRHIYFPISYLSPYIGNEAAHGFDTYGYDAVVGNARKRVLDKARDLGRAQVTARISIVQAENHAGLIIYHPIYTNALTSDSVTTRREQLMGYAAGVFLVKDMIAPVVKMANRHGLGIILRDLDSSDATQLLFDSRATQQEDLTDLPETTLVSSFIIDDLGRNWQLEFFDTQQKDAQLNWQLWFSLILGLLFSAVIALFLLLLSSKMESVKDELVVQHTNKLDQKNENRINLLLTARVAGGGTVVLSLIVIFGWYSKNTALIQIHPSFVAMQFNTALGFLLSGLGLIFLVNMKPKPAFIFGLTTALLGLLTLVQYASGINFGIDQLLMDFYVMTKATDPGRMSANTALCFFLVGVALMSYLALTSDAAQKLIQRLMGSIVFIFAVVAIVGYLIDIETAYGWTNLSQMALHTAIGFSLLGIGLVINSWNYSTWSKQSPFWTASVFVISVFLLFAAIVHESQIKQRMVADIVTEQRLDVIKNDITNQLKSTILTLKLMAERWEVIGGTPKYFWQQDAQQHLHTIDSLTMLQWVDNSYHVEWLEPLEGNEQGVGLDILAQQKYRNLIKNAATTNDIKLTLTSDFSPDYTALVAYVPLYVSNNFDGFIVGVIDLDRFFSKVFPFNQQQAFDLMIEDQAELVFKTSNADRMNKDLSSRTTLNLFNLSWTMTVAPNKGDYTLQNAFSAKILLLTGVLFSLLVGLTIYLMIISNRRNKLLAKGTSDLMDSEERHRVIVESSLNGLITIDDKGHIENYNPVCEKMFGYSPDEVLDKNIHLLILDPNNDYLENERDTGLDVVLGKDQQVNGLRQDGTVFPIELSVNQISIAGQTKFSIIVRDITERVEDERILKNIYDITLNNELSFEQKVAQLLDAGRAYLNQTLGIVSHIIDEDYEVLETSPRNALEQGTHFIVSDTYCIHTLGSREVKAWEHAGESAISSHPCYQNFGLETYIGASIFANGEAYGTINFTSPSPRNKPFTEREKAVINLIAQWLGGEIERKINNAEREQFIATLSDSNEELERFAYVCSHDMQEPLRMVRSFSEKLQLHLNDRLLNDEKGQRYFKFVIDGAARAQQLIIDILAYSSISQSTQALEEIDMNDMLSVVINNNDSNEQRADSITYDALPIIKGNKTQIFQLVQNLVNNGLKYQSPDSKAHVHVSVEDSGTHWQFAVKDNGIGIETRHLTKIFDVFQRLHRKDQFAGTGVGLSICKKVVERHGGKIWVESEHNQGSTFFFTILKTTS